MSTAAAQARKKCGMSAHPAYSEIIFDVMPACISGARAAGAKAP